MQRKLKPTPRVGTYKVGSVGFSPFGQFEKCSQGASCTPNTSRSVGIQVKVFPLENTRKA